MAKKTAQQLREEADRIEAEELKAERLKTADKIPTCPECGGRVFKVNAYTTVAQSISYEEDEDNGDWHDDYESGDHTDESESATCADCGVDARPVLEQHGWTFYGPPRPLKKGEVVK